jgi:hypothetical protein
MKTIFIAVAAYNEPYIDMMVNNCLDNADLPDRVHFGLWLHNNDGVVADVGEKANIKRVQLGYDTLLGVPPARLNAMSLYDGQDYYFQVDGHMLFERHWDSKIINYFEAIKQKAEKPIISTYTPWWSVTNKNINFYSNESNVVCAPMVLDVEQSIKEGYPKPKTEYSPWGGADHKEHHLISAHFLFTSPSFIQDILPDPLIMYSGEELTLAVRAWTRGYRMFCVKSPIAWHLNKGHGDQYEKDRRKDTRNKGPLYEHFVRKNNLGKDRAKSVLTGELLGYWGAESLEDLRRYEVSSGIDFKEIYKKIGEYDVQR